MTPIVGLKLSCRVNVNVSSLKTIQSTVEDPGFSRGEQQPKRGKPTYYSATFVRKLHETEENRAEWERGVRPKIVNVDLPLV